MMKKWRNKSLLQQVDHVQDDLLLCEDQKMNKMMMQRMNTLILLTKTIRIAIALSEELQETDSITVSKMKLKMTTTRKKKKVMTMRKTSPSAELVHRGCLHPIKRNQETKCQYLQSQLCIKME